MKWQVGDRALLVDSGANCSEPEYFGEVCELITFVGKYTPWGALTSPGWLVNCGGTELYVAQTSLRPIYNGNEIVSWESMKDIYQPSPVVTI